MGRVAGYFPFDVVADASEFGLTEEWARTTLGRLRVVRRGDRTPEVLLLHGVGLDWSAWTPLLAAAREEDGETPPWLMIDLPGFGASDALTAAVSLDQVAEALLEVLDQLGIERIALVGHSMGGFVALHLASRRPDRITRLAVLCGAYSTVVDIVNDPAGAARRSPRAFLIYKSLSGLARTGSVGERMIDLSARTGALRLALPGLASHPFRVRQSLLDSLDGGFRHASFVYAEATGLGYDYREVWAAVRVPTLAVFGADDALVSIVDRETFEAALPSAVVRVLDGASHLAPLERPFEVLAMLGDLQV
jgi:pimeloyl-ACP methyl ester carboxylesterase